jgi:hypothetical protein
MKKLLLLAFSLFSVALYAQPDNEFKDLLSLFVDQKYEKVLNKAENYTIGDETKKHPLPYLYIAMSLYEMSKIEKYTQMEEYKGAFKDAMKFCSKYAAKDKEKTRRNRRINRLNLAGYTPRDIAAKTGISLSTIYNVLNRRDKHTTTYSPKDPFDACRQLWATVLMDAIETCDVEWLKTKGYVGSFAHVCGVLDHPVKLVRQKISICFLYLFIYFKKI